jgi:hypothetical protein
MKTLQHTGLMGRVMAPPGEMADAGKVDAPAIETKSGAAEAEVAATPGARPSGEAYRAVIERGGAVIWRCMHVHFTEHSALHCPSLPSLAV